MPTTIPGYPANYWSAPYGGVPNVPDPLSTMQETIRGNIGALPNLYNLATGVSGASAAGARQQFVSNLPGYVPLSEKASQNTLANLQGVVNPDVINLLRSQGAERGVGFGVDSPASNAAYLRALGLTSTSLQNLGQQQYQSLLSSTPRGPLFDPASMLTSPAAEQSAQLYANILRGAPSPEAAARASEEALRRGLGTGAGAVGSGVGPALRSLGAPIGSTAGGYPPTVVGGSPATGTTIGGVTYYGGETPGSAADAWQKWASGLTGSTASPADEGNWWETDLDYLSGGAGSTPGTDYASYDQGYDPFGVMGPYENTPLGDMTGGSNYTASDYVPDYSMSDYFGDYP